MANGDGSGVAISILPGVDTLRLVAAACVAVAHGGLLPFSLWLQAHGGLPGHIAHQALGLVSGGFAVALFFILSGLCIHFPNVGKSEIDLPRYFAKRLTRIVPPLVIGMIVASAFGPDYRTFFDLALWSVYSEIAYYVVYPVVFRLCGSSGLRPAVLVSTALSLVLLACKPHALAFWEFGPLTWLVGAPLWLTGALAAESIRNGKAPLRGSLWLWRVAMIGLNFAEPILRFHSPILIGLGWLVPIISLVGYFWIRTEVDYHTRHEPIRILERLGLACYSSYLMHTIALVFVDKHRFGFLIAEPVVAIIVFSAIFYALVERPSHRLAHLLGRKLGRTTTSGSAIPVADGPI